MNAVTRTFSTIAAAGLLMGLRATASAKGVYDVRTPELPSRTFSVSDLNLTSADGAEALYERIRALQGESASRSTISGGLGPARCTAIAASGKPSIRPSNRPTNRC
jgi:hypothetical protein